MTRQRQKIIENSDLTRIASQSRPGKHLNFVLQHFKLPLFIILALAGQELLAVVNTESLRSNYFKDGDVSLIDGQVQTRQGNDDFWQIGMAIRYQNNQFQPAPEASEMANQLQRSFFIISDYNVAERRNVTFMRNGFTHLRWIFMKNEFWGHEYFIQHQFNSFMKLNTRLLVGNNIRLNLFQNKEDSLTLGLGHMVEYEKLSSDSFSTDNQDTFYRFNSYISFKQGRAKDLIQYSITTFFQPRFDLPSDYRVLIESEIQYRLTKLISLVFNLNHYYDSEPPLGILKQDWQSTYKIRLRF